MLPAIEPTSSMMLENKEAEDINIDYINRRENMVFRGFRDRDGAQYNPSFFPRHDQPFKRWVTDKVYHFNFNYMNFLDLLRWSDKEVQ